MLADTWSLTARWIFPVSAPPVERGIVVISGERIAAVEPFGTRKPDRDFGNAAILPGFVNAHTHLDLTGLRGLARPSPDFTGWLRQVISHRRQRHADRVRADVETGIRESLRAGVTLLGDISADGGSWQALSSAPVRAVVFREMIGLTPERASKTWEDANAWRLSHPATPTCRPGVSPHAPYSVRSSLFLAASTSGGPMAVHLAETEAETELLERRTGPFVPFLKELGAWAPDGLARSCNHVLDLCKGLFPALFVHGNYLGPHVAVPPNGSIVYCPRTHAAFGRPLHPFRDFLARGARVALGTDSLASNPDLDLLAEARFLHWRHPDFPGSALLRMATLSGAEALGWANDTGSLEPGKSADLVVLPLPSDDMADPHSLLFESDLKVSRVMWRGGTSFP